MDFSEIFRRFFGGYGPNNRGMDDIDITADEDDDNRDNFRGFGFFMHPPGSIPGGFGRGPPLGNNQDDGDDGIDGEERQFPHRGFPFSFDHEINQMFRHFEEMFRNFGLADFPPLDIPSIEPPPSGDTEAASPRDHMLKEPEGGKKANGNQPGSAPLSREPSSWFDELRKGRSSLFNPSRFDGQPDPSKKEDSDLDDIVRQGEMDRIFGSGSPEQPGSHDQPRSPDQPQIRTFSRSISIQTIRRPDGTIETRRTEQDGKGNTTTTVTTKQADPPQPWGVGPGNRGALPGLGGFGGSSEREHTDDPMFHRFFGSWFKK